MRSSMDVYVIMVEKLPGQWVRVGQVHRDKEVAKGWVPLVKEAWHGRPTRTRKVTIKTVDGKPTPEAVKMMSDKYNVDVT